MSILKFESLFSGKSKLKNRKNDKNKKPQVITWNKVFRFNKNTQGGCPLMTSCQDSMRNSLTTYSHTHTYKEQLGTDQVG